MTRFFSIFVAGLLGLGVVAGCSSGDGNAKLVLAPADGTVTFLGSPLAGANVSFLPENGPLATAVTDLSGKFTLRTGNQAGAALGPVKVTVSASSADPSATADAAEFSKRPESAADSQAYMKKANEMALERRAKARAGQGQPRSVIPDRYGKTQTSGLAYTIKADGDNHFKIELVD